MKINPNVIVWWSFAATAGFSAMFGVLVAVFAGAMKNSPRMKALPPSMSKTVDILILVVRVLAVIVIILSAFLGYKLFRLTGCVFPSKT